MDEEKGGKVVPIAGGGQPDKMREALRAMAASMEAMVEYQGLQARITREKYLALVRAGFDEKQALELCKVPIF